MEFKHISVLKQESIIGLNIKPDGIYVDCTTGGGGHSLEIAKRLTTGRLICFDKDTDAIAYAKTVLHEHLDKITFVNRNFLDIYEVLEELEISGVDGILADLGVSSYQIDTAERGFSFMRNARLDMRMNKQQSFDAYELLNTYNEQELAQIKKFIQTNRIAELYDPTISDPIKANFSNEAFMGNKLEFLSMWMKFLIKYPLDYIESFLCGNYGYWYPDAQNWAVTRSSDLGFKPILDTKIVPYIDSLIDRRDIPIITNLFSIGTNVWIMLIAFALCIYKKEYKLLIIFIPVITIVLTSMASPVFCEFRYVYGLFTTIPLLLAITYQKIKNCQRGRG